MLVVVLKCPECGSEQDFSSIDFEEDVRCEKCDFVAEAWDFWHRLKDHKPVGNTKEEWSMGAHYPNDALCLDTEQFLEYFYGRGGLWHGGNFYIWLSINETLDRKGEYVTGEVRLHLFSLSGFEVLDQIKHVLAKFAKLRKVV